MHLETVINFQDSVESIHNLRGLINGGDDDQLFLPRILKL